MISLTASENFTSKLVKFSHGTTLGSFYSFYPPYLSESGEWTFPDSGVAQRFSERLSNIAHSLFEARCFDWRPNGGSTSEIATMMGVCGSKGDAIIHFSHSDGGHFAIEPLAERLGIRIFHLPINQRTLLIDVERLGKMLREHPEIKLVMLDQSFKLREQPLEQIQKVLPSGVVSVYDCSHDAALIAGGCLKQPLANGIDILIGNTHKTIPGPQKAFIAYANPSHWAIQPISNAVVPTLQSNCHAECLLPMLISFKEIEVFGRSYAEKIISNAKAFAHALADVGFNVSGEHFGYTETHQVHVIIGSPQDALNALKLLHKAGIRVNNIEIPGARGSHGLRLGVQAMTRCGMIESDFEELARLMARLILQGEIAPEIRAGVEVLDKKAPRYPLKYSFDLLSDESYIKEFLQEIYK